MESVDRGDSYLFQSGPSVRLQRRLGLVRQGRPQVVRRSALVILIAWVPLALLTVLQDGAVVGDTARSFADDIAVHARFLFAAPLLILAEIVSASQLGAIALHFRDAGFVPEHDHPRFAAALASTKALLDSSKVEIAVIALAYLTVGCIVFSSALDQLPSWQITFDGTAPRFSVAGYWHVLVSLPLLLVLLFGWIWRLCLWTRFLWLMSRLDLRLAAVHPDNVAGLQFLGYSVQGYSVVALALASIIAGSVMTRLMKHDVLTLAQQVGIAATLLCIVAIFTAPLLVFCGLLLRTRRRGVFEYGAGASKFASEFERKWLRDRRPIEEKTFQEPDFSTATDLYQLVANVYRMRLVPVDLRSMIVLVVTVLVPFVPVVLITTPIDAIFAGLKNLLL
ncbi:hypothetical protein FJ938_19020 [Mesorhizobium sp. B2-4-14]|uniref:hypothetical protein n=1 Tax=Mesorhizobium sp. B2-4-14 TaxID=2589935 RepID=UPI00112C32F1|nr:hypothetical protein [Mesorhizobium sp. B2-4-14]TPL02544.1 hypothetical protein FJ938_19020 [Mesorhizobium sp. B2-4-14]